ncbi:MAG: pantetheine-phosphate adenylyltransferase [Gammaproteobacteria bacterium]
MKITAIYPGTFDPITNGHSDLVMRAARLFDQVIFAIAESKRKATLFSVEERMRLAHLALADIKNVEVCSFNNLVTNLAREKKAQVIIRGLRAVSDFDYEFQMAGMNRQLYDGAETVFMTPAENLGFISSSLVREIASLGGDVSPFVHAEVLKALKAHFR